MLSTVKVNLSKYYQKTSLKVKDDEKTFSTMWIFDDISHDSYLMKNNLSVIHT